ncbi:3-polyprenyl-4-hydroxybenzoate carboxylyase [Candidatus Photodesmus blepharus]|uniref:Flavin prenyltransferase UbiX n=1 Tax=Candidatus Photodesmus blepharonis TaxID=1179155 RepID=A0A084CM49_9GAMM|nr:flavin prenyltransferase UbiX [Candidatus Photodesmus blepharus]KEY90878.1 3-polyprenyl-4-hydroxybenzoate carboxylyase [Candidatus Photodesmus blepharus]
MIREKSITLAITGASGAFYALRLLECLLSLRYKVHLLISSAAKVVLAAENNFQLPDELPMIKKAFLDRFGCLSNNLEVYGQKDWFSPLASGSDAPKQMVVCPCSMGSVASIAHGISKNLIDRAADVVIKECGQLLLVVRETPFSTLHLANMYKLAQMGITIMPASPGFYHHPKSIADLVEFIVARILEHLDIKQKLIPRWGTD